MIEFHFFAHICRDLPTPFAEEAIFAPFYASPPLCQLLIDRRDLGLFLGTILRKGLMRPHPCDTAGSFSEETATGENEYRRSVGCQALQWRWGCNDQERKGSKKALAPCLKGNLKSSQEAFPAHTRDDTAASKIPYSFPNTLLTSGLWGVQALPCPLSAKARSLSHS